MWNTHTTFQWITGYNLKMYTVTILYVKNATILPQGSKRYLCRFPFCTLTCFTVHQRERRRKNSTRILAPNLHHVGLVARPIEICSRLMLGSMVDHPAPAEKWISEPIRSIYGIFAYIWLIFMVDVGKYIPYRDPMGMLIFQRSNCYFMWWFKLSGCMI